ncbi:hypothetical protein RO3G_10268 [Rhizopus delemar RA 99-880]|uniref:Uncharacterized protein n=1 Tax=Rhizopus delemar (strain RA 99-880 / ATCC MYA-4621 / FGSC 9543 / NRRL 43880) TaxID=246409 RepID=I1CAS8_RHIO9|nr:hypothetical protein RO3G_10268 [Rhizopus delemar RA 99-880]|eukprot:EIE85558.1 hypothetical protein RO3G_10268 [Rhizopus delemar RA 99-880]
MPNLPFVKDKQSISNDTGGKIRNIRNSRHILRIAPSVCWITHESLAVQNISGVEELRGRLWNQNLVACPNMIHIVRNLRLNSEIPESFQRVGLKEEA